MNCLTLYKVAMSKVFVLVMPLFFLAAAPCSGIEGELLQGILQDVDAVNGEITITTKDGKTVTLNIATEAPVETESGGSTVLSSYQTLEPGTSVEVELAEDGQVVQGVKARLAKLEATIVEVKGDEVTVESSRGRRATVTVTDRTRIELEDDFPAGVTDLLVGSEVKIKFDPDSGIALRIETEDEEADIDGTVVQVDRNQVTIETERGRRLTMALGDHTQIALEDDFPGTYSDLEIGGEVEVKFDPFTRTAYRIEVGEPEQAQIKGVVARVGGDEIIIETERGRSLTLVIGAHTQIDFADDFPGTFADVQVGDKVEARFDSLTRMALNIEVAA